MNITDAVAEVNGHVVFGTPKSHQARWLPVPAFRLNELRHTAASFAISAGATVKIVCSMSSSSTPTDARIAWSKLAARNLLGTSGEAARQRYGDLVKG